MFSNTEFNHLKLKLDQLYLSLSGGKVNGETVFSKKVTFGSGDKVIKIYDGKIEGLDSPEGHTYDLEPSSDKSELLFTEDGTLKDTLPVNTNYVGTRARWNTLTAAEKAKYLTMDFLGDEGNGDISDKAITYTSSDVADGNANDWTVVTPITTGLSLNTLFSRVSQMFKNVRYLYKIATEVNKFGDVYTIIVSNLSFTGGTNRDVTYTLADLPKGKYLYFFKMGNSDGTAFSFYNYTEGGGYLNGSWSISFGVYGGVLTHNGGAFSKTSTWKQNGSNLTKAWSQMYLVRIGV